MTAPPRSAADWVRRGAFIALVAASGTLLGAELVSAQGRGPCSYRAADGRVVITDDASDPRCAQLRVSTKFRPPGRLRMNFQVVELIAMAHAAAERHQVDHRLVEALVETESGFDPRAVSRQGALGLMQLMPQMAERLGVVDPFDPRENLDAGVRYLRQLLLKYRSDLPRALAAYNAGEGVVDRYRGVPPYPETREYVRRVLFRFRQRVQAGTLH